MSESKNILSLKNIKFSYNKNFTLSIPDLNIEKGSSIGLAGSNGCGKSTLMKMMAMLITPDSGEILFNDRIISPGNIIIRNKITYLLQEPYLLKRTVFDNIAYGLKQKKDCTNLKNRVFMALEDVALNPELFAKRKWHELSGGEVQRVSLAARIILKPEIIILDEPISNTDHESSEIIKNRLLDLNRNFNTTIICSSHDQAWLNSITDDIYKMHNGKIIGSESENIIHGPWHEDYDGLWSKKISECDKIYSSKPPEDDSIALLHPGDIIISNKKPDELSAQNIIFSEIKSLSAINNSSKVKIEVMVNEIKFTCHLTEHAIHELKLIPGKKIWLIFKASSLRWN